MLRHPLTFTLFILSLVGILGCSYAWKQLSPEFTCGKWGFIRTENLKYYINPEKIVIEPWRGQHNVYGIFMVPDEYKHDYLITIDIPGHKTYCGILLYPSQNHDGIEAKPGYHLMKGFLQTRTTLRLIIEGKLNQLQQPDNWKLGYVKEPKNPAQNQ